MLVVINYFTRWTEAFGFDNQAARSVALKLISEIIYALRNSVRNSHCSLNKHPI